MPYTIKTKPYGAHMPAPLWNYAAWAEDSETGEPIAGLIGYGKTEAEAREEMQRLLKNKEKQS